MQLFMERANKFGFLPPKVFLQIPSADSANLYKRQFRPA